MEENEDEPEDVRLAAPVEDEIKKGLEDEPAILVLKVPKKTVKVDKKKKKEDDDCCTNKKKVKTGIKAKWATVHIFEKECKPPKPAVIPRQTLSKKEHLNLLSTPSKKCPPPCLTKPVIRKVSSVPPRILELAKPKMLRILDTIEKQGDALEPELLFNLMKLADAKTFLTPEQAADLFRDKKSRSSKKYKKKREKKKCSSRKDEDKGKEKLKVNVSGDQPTFDPEAVCCQYLMAEKFVKSILNWKCPIPKEEFHDIAEVILKRLSFILEYTPVDNGDRKSQQMRFLADVVSCWIAGVLIEVAEAHRKELEEECERKRREQDEETEEEEEDEEKSDAEKDKEPEEDEEEEKVDESVQKDDDDEEKKPDMDESGAQTVEPDLTEKETETEKEATEEGAEETKEPDEGAVNEEPEDKEEIQEVDEQPNLEEESEQQKVEVEEEEKLEEKVDEEVEKEPVEEIEKEPVEEVEKEESEAPVITEPDLKQPTITIEGDVDEGGEKEIEQKSAENLESKLHPIYLTAYAKKLKAGLSDRKISEIHIIPSTARLYEDKGQIPAYKKAMEDKIFRSDVPFITFHKIFNTIYNMVESEQENFGEDPIVNRLHRSIYEKFHKALELEDPALLTDNAEDEIDVVTGKLAIWVSKLLSESELLLLNKYPPEVESFEVRDWSKWLEYTTKTAEVWAKWLQSVIKEAQTMQDSKITRGKWQEWTKDLNMNATLWRRFHLDTMHKAHHNAMMIKDREVVKTGEKKMSELERALKAIDV